MKKINLKTTLEKKRDVRIAESRLDYVKKYGIYESVKNATETYTRVMTEYQESVKDVMICIDDVQKRCKERIITYEDVLDFVEKFEKKYRLSKKAMKGTVIHVNYFCERYPNAYRYIPESTAFSVVHDGKAWSLSDVRRENCNRSPKNKYNIILSDEGKKEMMLKISTMDF